MLFRLFFPQDSSEDQPVKQGEEPKPKPRSGTVDLELDTSLQVEISDAVSEQDKVKFTVHTKVITLYYVWEGTGKGEVDCGHVWLE